MLREVWVFFLLAAVLPAEDAAPLEEDWGNGLKVLKTYLPDECEHKTKKNDVVHYHYVGRLGENGNVFGRSFDYDSPYIVSIGHGRIIAGMDRGLMNMCLWERRKITIPPHLGYGQRGVGQVIPPNSTLVFYVRLIKIERNGHSLGEDTSIEDLWTSGLVSYSSGEWEQAIDSMEEALRLFYHYDNQTYICLKKCKEEGSDFKLSKKEREVVDSYSANDGPMVEQFLVYAARGKCVRQCKAEALPPKLRTPDSSVLRLFWNRTPYSYLHYAYYQLGRYEDGAKCLFTFYFYNPEDELAISNMPFYRNQLELSEGEFVWREPGILPHQAAFLAGKAAYEHQMWLKSSDHFERSLTLYSETLNDCALRCEDILVVNLTQRDMNPQKKAKFEEYSFVPDTMEYYQLLVTVIREVLACRVNCQRSMATIEGDFVNQFLSSQFHYLQFNYYKLGQLKKAAEAAATFIALEPSDQVMAKNIHYYTTNLKLEADAFVPRQEFVDIHERLETEKRLLYFAEHGEAKKKEGQRGDDARLPPNLHQEL